MKISIGKRHSISKHVPKTPNPNLFSKSLPPVSIILRFTVSFPRTIVLSSIIGEGSLYQCPFIREVSACDLQYVSIMVLLPTPESPNKITFSEYCLVFISVNLGSPMTSRESKNWTHAIPSFISIFMLHFCCSQVLKSLVLVAPVK